MMQLLITSSKKTVVLNEKKHNGGAGLNKQTLWFRKSSFQKWIDAKNRTVTIKRQNEKGFVYFIHQEGNFTQFKIGYATDLNKRLRALQTGNPNLLIVYRVIENVTRKTETELHHFFYSYRIRNEWFSITTLMIYNMCIMYL